MVVLEVLMLSSTQHQQQEEEDDTDEDDDWQWDAHGVCGREIKTDEYTDRRKV